MAKKKTLTEYNLYRVRTEQLGEEYVIADSIKKAIDKALDFSLSLNDAEDDFVVGAQELGRVIR